MSDSLIYIYFTASGSDRASDSDGFTNGTIPSFLLNLNLPSLLPSSLCEAVCVDDVPTTAVSFARFDYALKRRRHRQMLLVVVLMFLARRSTAAALSSRLYVDMNTLDAPDVSYYGASGALNASAVRASLAPLLSLAPALAASNFTGVVLEATGIEDFISYDYLGNGTEVYASGDAHRARASEWGAALAPALAELAAHNLSPHLMFFDLMYPPALAARFNLSLHSSDLRAVLTARFMELFARLPALRGVLLYVSDCWSPRGGYEFKQLWASLEDLAAVATLYYETFTAAAPPGARLIFSLWVPPGAGAPSVAEAWALLRNSTPPSITFAVHDSEGDFSVASPINELLAVGAARDRALFVGSDGFRQLDGWGRLLASPAGQWAQRLQFAAGTGAVGGMVYSDWSPGITWPDSGHSLQNWTTAKGPASWRAWPRFRSFGLRELGLFSPSEGNVAVLAGLYADADADPLGLLSAWAQRPPLSLAPAAAMLLADAYNASFAGWAAKYLPGVDRYAIEWNSVFTPKVGPNAESAGGGLTSLYENATLAAVDAANAEADGAFAAAEDLVLRVLAANGTTVMSVDGGARLSNAAVEAQPGAVGAALLLAAQKTRATGALFCGFRLAAWLNNSLGSGVIPRPQACARQGAVLADLTTRLAEYAALYPEEGVRWSLIAADPALDVRPIFFRESLRSMDEWVPLFEEAASAACSRTPDSFGAFDYDVLVFGASSAGVAAAITASANGTRRVALVDPLALPGGMLSAGGLALQDQLDDSYTRFFVSGVAREWADRVRASYGSTEDVLTPDAFVAQAAVDAMLAARPSIDVLTSCALISVARAGAALASVTLDCRADPVSAAVFIDASYAGDLLVASGVPFAAGREANTTYGETLGGVLRLGGGDGEDAFTVNVSAVAPGGGLLPGVSNVTLPPVGSADDGLMAFGHRACVTTDSTRVPFPAPAGYARTDHALLQELIDAAVAHGNMPKLSDFVALIPFSSAVAKAGRNKFMLCCGGWPVNGDAVTLNAGYVGAAPAARKAFDAAHTRYLLGALHYLSTDSAVPPATRADVSRFGLCSDEWPTADPAHWPPQVYVREGARLVNDAVLTQTTLVQPRSKSDGIAVGAWYFDKHVVRRVDAAGFAANEGHFRAPTSWAGSASGWCRQRSDACRNVSAEWYDVPLSALLPRRTDSTNLLVAAALAASSVAFSSTRIESMFMGTGAAAGVAARLAAVAGVAVQDIAVADVQNELVHVYAQSIHGPPTR